MKRGWVLAGLATLAALTLPAARAQPADDAPTATRWSFALPAQATTSAGVYSRDGTLIRTLWRAEPLAAGPHEGAWDGRDDRGVAANDSSYEIRLVHHRIRYVWEGVYGNSSVAAGGPDIHNAYLPPTSLVWDGDRVIYAVGFNEGRPGLHAFPLSAPQHHTLPFASSDRFAAVGMVAADANRLYWANIGGMSKTSFVGAYDLQTAKPAKFSAGQTVCLIRMKDGRTCYPPQEYPGVVSVETQEALVPTGLAVQRRGRILAVSHGTVGKLRLFDKASGELLREIQLPLAAKRLNQIAMTPAGDLWVISGRKVLRYTDLERSPTVETVIEDLVLPIALATHPEHEDEVWIADGAASQQLKRYDRTGRLRATLGRPAGYESDPEVAPDKLCFKPRNGHDWTAMVLTPDARLWVVDYCNNRVLRFRTDAPQPPASDAQIAYLPGFYSSTVDHANPRRVFANFLEFDTEPDTPITPGRSWKLVRNWVAGLPASLADTHAFNAAFGGFQAVKTFSNGRTYGILRAHGRQVLVELPASGPLRVVKTFGQPLPGATPMVMYENGDLGYGQTGSQTQRAMRLPLTGHDANGDPVWAHEPVVLASVPLQPGTPYYRGAFSGGMPPRFPLTSSGKVIFFDQSVMGNEGFHLGAADRGGTSWLWQASPSGLLDGKGSFQTRALDRSVHYGGNVVWAHGRHIVFGYHGEGIYDRQTERVGQANQFMHFDESGLFLGQFGQPSTRPSADPTQPGLSGNSLSPTLVRHGKHLYLYHNEEASHGGVHRWRIDGWDDVRELRGTGLAGATIELR
ncbi:MAG: hypothetical protein H7Y33_11200 [Cytophagales bacterium]|nr:hypothetical protein [Rhizobacter sp.]